MPATATAAPPSAPIRFDGWTLRSSTGELEKDGVRVRLQEHPLQLLEELLAQPGELVTREQLIARLWPKGVVDFDTALNSTVRRLRAALDDDADAPRYIETIPRRGYRFIGTLQADRVMRTDQPAASTRPAAPSRSSRLRTVLAIALIVIAVGAIAALGSVVWLERKRAAAPQNAAATSPAPVALKSIAVLPFVDLSEEQDQQYFSDGLTEELLNLLTQVPSLRVIARTSSFSFKGQNVDIATVADKLGVTHVLEGSVRKSGERVRITAQLIETAGSTHLWSQTYDRTLDDLIDVQSDIATSVTQALHVALAGGVAPSAAGGANARAYELVLRARFLFYRRATGDVARAQQYYEQARELDPGSARAWAGLASTYWLQTVEDEMPRAVGLAKVRAAAERAIELDPNLAEGYIRLANVAWISGDQQTGDEYLRTAARLEPSSTLVLSFLAGDAVLRGDLAAGIDLARRVTAIDPLSRVSRANLAHALYSAGRLAEAKDEWQAAQDLEPSSPQEGIGYILILERRFEEALRLVSTWPRDIERTQCLALIHHALGHQREADEALQELIRLAAAIDPAAIAEVYAWRREKDEAFRWLGTIHSVMHPPGARGFVRVNWPRRSSPFLKPLDADPRWNAWLASLQPKTDR